jgi:hypothetical protein
MKANEELATQVNLPPDLETLVNKRLSSGGYASVEDVFRRALEAQTPRKAGLTRNDGPWRPISRKGFYRPSVAS